MSTIYRTRYIFVDMVRYLCYCCHGGVIMNDFQKYLDDNLAKIHIEHEIQVDDNVEKYDIFEEIRDEIISLRRSINITQKELSQRAGITQANLSNIEKGVAKPTLDSLKKIADATGTRLIVDFIGQVIE